MFEGTAGVQCLTDYVCTCMMHINTAPCLQPKAPLPVTPVAEGNHSVRALPECRSARPTDATRAPHEARGVIAPRLPCAPAPRVQGLFLPKLLPRSSKARPSLLPRRFKWGWVKLRKGVILSVLPKHAVKPVFRKRRNAIKTVLLYNTWQVFLSSPSSLFLPFFLWQWALKRPQRRLYADQRNSFYKQAKKGLY